MNGITHLENQVLLEMTRAMVWQWVVQSLFPMFSDQVSVHDRQSHCLYEQQLML